jgi:hypothetical protein
MFRTLPATVAGPSHAFVRAHARRRVASCRAGSATSAGSTHAAARTRSRPSGGRRCGFGPSVLLPHLRCDWAHSCHTMAEPGTALPHPTFGVARGRCARVMRRRCRRAPSSRRRSRTSSRSSSRKSTACRSARRLFGHICAGSIDPRGCFCRGLLCSAAGTRRSCRTRSCSTTCARARSRSWCAQPSPGADVQMWEGRAQSRCRCGRGGPSPGADVAAVSQSWCRCGRGGPSPGADVGGVGPVLVQMWEGWAQSRCRCGRGGPSPGADVGGVSPVPAQMWQRIRRVRALSCAAAGRAAAGSAAHRPHARACGGIGGRAFRGKGTENTIKGTENTVKGAENTLKGAENTLKGTDDRGKRTGTVASRAFRGCSLTRPTGTSRRWALWGSASWSDAARSATAPKVFGEYPDYAMQLP